MRCDATAERGASLPPPQQFPRVHQAKRSGEQDCAMPIANSASVPECVAARTSDRDCLRQTNPHRRVNLVANTNPLLLASSASTLDLSIAWGGRTREEKQ